MSGLKKRISDYWQKLRLAIKASLRPASKTMPPLVLTGKRESQIVLNRWVLILSTLIALGFAGLFLAFPRLDVEIVRRWVFDDGFIISRKSNWAILRIAVMRVYLIYYIAMALLTWLAWSKRRIVLGFHPIEWLYMVACSIAGPVLVANVWMKTFIARPRPINVVEFGGEHNFVAAFRSGGTCVENCSFVSGEVSSMAMIFASLMLLGRPSMKIYFFALIFGSLLSMWLRVGMGGHFPSDTIFAVIFMVIIAAVLYRLIVLSPKLSGVDK